MFLSQIDIQIIFSNVCFLLSQGTNVGLVASSLYFGRIFGRYTSYIVVQQILVD